MKATEQYFLVALFIMLYKVVLTFESVDESNSFLMNCLVQIFLCKMFQKFVSTYSLCHVASDKVSIVEPNQSLKRSSFS